MRSARIVLAALAGCCCAALPLAGCSKDLDEALPQEELLRACLVSSSCGLRPYPRASNCVDAYHTLQRAYGLGPIFNALYRCVNQAASCGAAAACWGIDRAAARCDTSFKARCDGDRAISCDALTGFAYAESCGEAGLACAVPTSSQPFEARCTPGTCDGAARRCDGSRLLSCSSGVLEVDDCGLRGLACAVEGCAGTGEACSSGGFTARCEGETAVSCVGGRVQREDCAARAYNRRCAEGRCVPAGGECLDEFDRCQGSALQACVEGSWRTFDCAALGLGPCQAAKNGASCTPLD